MKFAVVQFGGSNCDRDTWHVLQEVLGVDKAGVDDNFFDLGGNSLLVTQVHARIKPLFAREVRVVDLFRFPTIRALCAHFGQGQDGAAAAGTAIRERAQRQQRAMRKSPVRRG